MAAANTCGDFLFCVWRCGGVHRILHVAPPGAAFVECDPVCVVGPRALFSFVWIAFGGGREVSVCAIENCWPHLAFSGRSRGCPKVSAEMSETVETRKRSKIQELG